MCSLGWGYGGLGMLGGYALGSAYSPYYYGGYDSYPPTYTIAQEPTVLVPSSSSTESSSSASSTNSTRNVGRYDPAIHYEERKRFHQKGHGPNPDVIFHMIQHKEDGSCGIPGPYCPVGSSQHVFIPSGHLPVELSDIYTPDEYLVLVDKINSVNHKYQTHTCPMFCLWFCCIPVCIQSSRQSELKNTFDIENDKLTLEGLYWELNWNEEDQDLYQYRHETSLLSNMGFELVAHLKVNGSTRQQYEIDNPNSRKLFKQAHGYGTGFASSKLTNSPNVEMASHHQH